MTKTITRHMIVADFDNEFRLERVPDVLIGVQSYFRREKLNTEKPSHFGSYCHSSPSGITSTDNASIGGRGGFTCNGIPNYRKPKRVKPHQRCR